MKTCREEQKSLHFFAPEYGGKSHLICLRCRCDVLKCFCDIDQLISLSAVASVTTAVDIYSFGMCALEVRGDLVLL